MHCNILVKRDQLSLQASHNHLCKPSQFDMGLPKQLSNKASWVPSVTDIEKLNHPSYTPWDLCACHARFSCNFAQFDDSTQLFGIAHQEP